MVSAASLCTVLARNNRGLNALRTENEKTRETRRRGKGPLDAFSSIASGHMIDPENPLLPRIMFKTPGAGHVDGVIFWN
jgi:hypothetical protein